MRTLAPASLPIFRSAQQLAILATLFGGRGVELSVSALAQTTGVAVATASREVERLEAHGIVRSRNVGRSRLVSANWDLPWADALASILAHTAGLPARLVEQLGAVHGVHDAYVYGSWAARQAGEVGPPPHDIDLLVVGPARLADVRQVLRTLERVMGLEINPVIVSDDEWENADNPFLEELRSRPIFQLDFESRRRA